MAGFGTLNREVEVNNSTGGGGGITLLEDGVYQLEIIESDVKPNSKGTGQNFDFKVQVAEGEAKGEWFFGGVTSIQHTSAQAQTIGQGQLKALCEACGVDYAKVQDTEELHFKPFYADVRSETYWSNKHSKNMTKNVIARYLWEGMPDADAEVPASPPPGKAEASAAPPPAAADTGAAKKKMPWDK